MTPVFTGVLVHNIQNFEGMLEDFIARVFVSGTTPLPYVEPFFARFDDEPIEGIAIDLFGTGFTGYLKNLPVEGAKLFVQFEGEDPIDTGLTFKSDTGPIA